MLSGSVEQLASLLIGREPGVTLIAYARSSTDEQSESVRQQFSQLGAAWKAAGVLDANASVPRAHSPHGGWYADEGLSGWKTAPHERPGASELLAFCAANPQPVAEPGIITLWALSRLGRFKDGPAEAIACLYQLHRLGWRVCTISEGELSCVDEGRLMTVIKVALKSETDTASSETKSIDVARGKRDFIEFGVWPGGEAPYGYERWAARISGDDITWIERLPPGKRNGFGAGDVHTLLRPDARADTAKRIWEWVANGDANGRVMSTHAISRILNTEGVPGPGDGFGWYPSSVEVILRNRAYCARQSVAGKEYPARWEALIDDATYRRAHRNLAQNRKAKSGVNSDYLLSGLLECAACGRHLFGRVDRKNSTPTRYYCTNSVSGRRRSEQCSVCVASVRADQVEPAVMQAIRGLAHTPEARQAIEQEWVATTGATTSVATQLATHRSELAEVERSAETLVALVATGGAVGAAALTSAEKLNAQAKALTAKIDSLLARGRNPTPVRDYLAEMSDFDALMANASMEERKRLLRRFVLSVIVNGTKQQLRIVFRPPTAPPPQR